MCFEFGCFGGVRPEDIGGERPPRREPRGHGRRRSRGNGAHHSNADHKAPAPAYHNQQPHSVAIDEAGHKAYHDGARKDHHAAVITDAGGDRGYTAYVQDKTAEYDTPKLPAWHNKMGNDADYTYTTRLHEAPAGPGENAGFDYGHYPTTTTTTTLTW